MLRELRALFEEVGDEVIEALEGVVDAVEPQEEGEVDAELDAGDEVVGDEVVGDGGGEPQERRLELVGDTPIQDYGPEPRFMPVEAVAPEMLRGADEADVIDLPGLAADDTDDEPPEGA